MEFSVTQNSIQIIDSYTFSKIDFDRCLDYIEDKYYTNVFDMRGRKSLKKEWAMYNLMYRLGINRKSTGNVTLVSHITKFRMKLFNIIGSIAFLIID